MLVFDQAIVFEPDDTAVIWATERGGIRFKLCVPRCYAEQKWRIRYSEAAVTTQIWFHIDDLREAGARKLANGENELVL